MSGWEGPPPREICIVMLSAIGDAVHVLPVAGALKRAWPQCRITWVVQPVPYRLVVGHPAIDEFIVFDRRRGPAAWRSFAEARRALRRRHFDLLLGLQVYFKAGLLTALADAGMKLGFDRARARDLQWLFTNRRIPAHEPQHVQDQYFEFLEYLGVSPEPVSWGLTFNEDERRAQRSFFDRLDRPACAVVLGTSKPEKNWSPDGYARVLEGLGRDFGMRPVLVGGPSDTERRIANQIERDADAPVVNALGDDVRRLAWLLDGSELVISPDTGPLHIARALGTPVIGLYGHTNPKRTGPYRAFEDLVVDGYTRREGGSNRASATQWSGMQRVTPERVLEKVALALERYCH
ncbi:MAG: glycosyltransferase family 9 protein [Gemmatimonadota bacterium]